MPAFAAGATSSVGRRKSRIPGPSHRRRSSGLVIVGSGREGGRTGRPAVLPSPGRRSLEDYRPDCACDLRFGPGLYGAWGGRRRRLWKKALSLFLDYRTHSARHALEPLLLGSSRVFLQDRNLCLTLTCSRLLLCLRIVPGADSRYRLRMATPLTDSVACVGLVHGYSKIALRMPSTTAD